MCVRRIKSLKGNLNKIIQGKVFKIFNIVNCNQLNTIEESTIIPVIDLSINANEIPTTQINPPPAKSALNN